MHASVELELEEVDSIHDEQLLRRANVSPFFTSVRPPFALLSDLDFSPQALSSTTEDIASTTTGFTSVSMLPLNLDTSDDASCASPPLPLSTRAFDVKSLARGCELQLLTRVASQEHVETVSNDESPGSRHELGASVPDSSRRDRSGHIYSRSEAVECLGCGEYTTWRRNDRTELSFERRDPFREPLSAVQAGAQSRLAIVSDMDSRLFQSSARNRDGEARMSRTQLGRWSALPNTRHCEAQKMRREKLFPQQHDPSGYFVQKTLAPSPNMFRMIPFPAEALSRESSSASSRERCVGKKQLPLPDTHRTAKTRKASRTNALCSASPLTEFSKRYARDCVSAVGFFAPEALPPNQSPPRLFPLLPRAVDGGDQDYGTYLWRCQSFTTLPHPPHFGWLAETPSLPRLVRHERKIGIYSPETRRARIKRFHEKRKQLVFCKRVTYACRKRLAIACPRVNGRFVKKGDDLSSPPSAPLT